MWADLTRLFSLRGRTTRFGFWTAGVAIGLAFAVLFVFIETAFARSATLILYPLFFWLTFALAVRRLHDRGRSAWRLLLLAIPLIGPIWIGIELGFLAGTPHENRYGPDPYARADYLTVSF